MAGKFMTVKPSVCIPTMHRSNNQINFKNSKLLSFPLSGLHHNAGSSRVLHTTRQNTTSASFHCRSTKAENLAETSSFGGDFGVRKQFFLNLQAEWFNCMLFPLELMKYALSAISKSVLLGFASLLHLKSLKTEPMSVFFNDLICVDDIILEFQDIISILHGKSEYKNFRAKLPIGVFLYGPPGTGKGTLAHAMAREANVPFFCFSACYIRRGDVRIKSLFDEARRCSPSIVFIDDVHEIASQRENCDSDPNLVELHTELEKCNEDGSMVVFIAATDSPETLDSTFMSSCQFYKTFHVAKPDEDSRRKKAAFCFEDHIKEEDKEAICNLVASQTSGLGWAHLENIVVESRVAAKYRGGGHVTIDDVREAIRGYDGFIKIMKMIELHNNPLRLIVGSQN